MSEIPMELMMHAERLYDEGGQKTVPTIIAEAILAEREAIKTAMNKAAQLYTICTDWNLEEVEIDTGMVSVRDLRDEFEAIGGEA